jgi:hypothetical protein
MSKVENNKIVLDGQLPHHSHWVFKDSDLSEEDREWLEADLNEDDDKPD